MKVILINGSRRENGCTNRALDLMIEVLNEEGIETEKFFIGKRVNDGEVNAVVKEIGEKMAEADGLVVGSPVYYASCSGEVRMVLDRLFWNYGRNMRLKPAAAIVSARRAGTTASLDELNKYFMISEMPVVSSRYWNMVHGNTPEEVMQDEEGVEIVRTLGRNMAWMLKCIEAAKEAGVEAPEKGKRVSTNFIR